VAHLSMKRFKNRKAEKFTESIPRSSVENSGIESRCKFNFSYFTKDSESQSFEDWAEKKTGASSLKELMVKLQNYSKESLAHWNNEPIGKGTGHVLEIYGEYPTRSQFKKPPAVPHDVKWARFRIANSSRLIGFVIDDSLNHKIPEKKPDTFRYCSNTFYVVFLDNSHKFYVSKK